MSATDNAPRIIIIEPGGQRRPPVELSQAGLVIGRETGRDIVLNDPLVSRQHARVSWDGQRVQVVDLGSSNGTSIGDASLLPHEPREWPAGEWLRIGAWFLQLEMPAAHAGQRAASTPSFETIVPGPGAVPAPPPISNPPSQPPVSEQTSTRIRVVAEPNTLTITPGQPASVRVTLANTGPTVDHLRVSVEGVPAEWVQGHDREVQLNPGAQLTVPLMVNVARTAQNRSGQYPVTIRARSRDNPTESGAAPGLWTVLPFSMSGMTIAPARAHGKKVAAYTLTLQNESNSAAEFEMSGNDEEDALRYRFGSPSIYLEPGASTTVPLNIHAPRRMVGSSIVRRFTIRARNLSGGGPPQTTQGEFVHRAVFPVWAPVLALMVLVAGGFLLYSVITRPPEIVAFEISPNNPVTGEPVTVTWKVKRADKLRLGGYADNLNPSEGRYVIEEGIPTNTQLYLFAENRWKKVERPLPVNVFNPDPTPTTEPGAPIIARFDAQPRRVNPGDRVTVSWKVDEATTVEISHIGTVDHEGERTDEPFQTRSYTLTARNGAKSVTAVIEVVVVPLAAATQAPQGGQTPPDPAGGNPTQPPMGEPTPTMEEATPAPTVVQGGGGNLVVENQTIKEVIMATENGQILYGRSEALLYRSDDGGQSWRHVGDAPLGRIVAALNNPDVLYNGDHPEPCYQGGSIQPLRRSVDGGQSWQQFDASAGIRPLDVFAADRSRVLGSDCQFMYSQDGGQEFTYVPGPPVNTIMTSHAVSGTDMSRVAIGIVSTDGQGVQTGQLLIYDVPQPGPPGVETLPQLVPHISPFGFYPDDGVVAWGGNFLIVATRLGVYVSEDGGDTTIGVQRTGLEDVTFSQNPLDSPSTFPTVEFNKPVGFTAAIIDPSNDRRMWIAGKRGVYRSTDGGRSWSRIVELDDVESMAISLSADLLFVSAGGQTTVWTLDGR